MGHSGRTSGATGAPGEMAFNEAVGAACARLLNRDGWQVRCIRADPAASAYRGNAFVAVHADGSTNPRVRGASVGYQGTAGARVANDWRSAYVARGFTGPWHTANYTTNLSEYYGVRIARQEGNHRACIVECGTITNAEDRALMDPTRVALAIGDAVGIDHGWDEQQREDEDLDATEHGWLDFIRQRVGGMMPQRYYKPVPDSRYGETQLVSADEPGAVPAAVLDQADGNYLAVGLQKLTEAVQDLAQKVDELRPPGSET
jgi:hypothetical protein